MFILSQAKVYLIFGSASKIFSSRMPANKNKIQFEHQRKYYLTIMGTVQLRLSAVFFSVLRIRDILVRIRNSASDLWFLIRIRLLSSLTFNTKQFLLIFPAYSFLKEHLSLFFTKNKSLKRHKTVGIKVFLTTFA